MPTKAWIEAALAAISKKETELDFSGQRLDAGDFVSIASAISSKALLKLNISNTDLCAEGATVLAAALGGNQSMTELNIANNHVCVKAGRSDMSGVIAIANSIKNMGALTKFDISQNNFGAAGGKALAEGLKGHQVITELNIADNFMAYGGNVTGNMSGVIGLADAIPDMGALTHLNVSGNSLGHLVPPEGWEAHSNGTHYRRHGGNAEDWSTTVPAGSQPLGIIAIANAIPGMGILTSLHVGQNGITQKEMGEIIAIAMRMDSMKILCKVPFKDKTLTELDVSRKNLGTEGALVVAEYLNDNEAMTTLIFGTMIFKYDDYSSGRKKEVIPEPVTLEVGMTEADFSNKTSEWAAPSLSRLGWPIRITGR
jgi:Ran GTPase-activating protein (RanGAP) involved in mRNA processing and transport